MRPEEPVSRVMTETVVVIDVERPVSEVLDCFFQYPIHHLPVVRNGKLTGMISSADVMKLEYFVPKATVDRAQFLDERMTIERLMRSPVLSLGPDVGGGEAEKSMKKTGVHAVAVVDDVESSGSYPAMVLRSKAQSSALCAIGPAWSRLEAKATMPRRETRP